MLEPKKIKYRKVHRGNRKGMAKGGTEVNFGSYGMKAMEPGWITARQIEATRISISRSCLLYTSPSPRDKRQSRMPSSA